MNGQIETLARMRSRVRLLYGGYLLCLLACVVVLYFHQILASIGLGLCVAVYFLVVRRGVKGYRTAVRAACIRGVVERCARLTNYRPKGGLEQQEVDCWRLLPAAVKGGFLVRDLVEGTAGPLTLRGCDLTMAYAAGRPRETPVLTGFWCELALPRDTGLRLRLMDSELIPEPVRVSCMGDAVQVELPGLERLRAYRPEGAEKAGDSALAPDTAARLEALAREAEGMAVGIEGDRLCCFLKGRFLSGPDVDLRTPVDRRRLEANPLPQLEQLVDLTQKMPQ